MDRRTEEQDFYCPLICMYQNGKSKKASLDGENDHFCRPAWEGGEWYIVRAYHFRF